MAKAKAHFYWRIKNSEDVQDPFDIVVAPDIPTAVEVYLSQYDYLYVESITKVELLGSVLIDEERL